MAPPRRKKICSLEGCGSTSFHTLADGYVYCRNGHQQEQEGPSLEQDDMDTAQLGMTSQRRKDHEVVEKIKQQLAGEEGYIHFLKCHQLILWKQTNWLVEVQRLPKDLEIVVRDLWTLRLSQLGTKIDSSNQQSNADPVTPTSNAEEPDDIAPEDNLRQPLLLKDAFPKLVQTLALCYLGILFLRIPIALRQLHSWARAGDIPYLHATASIPAEMLKLLPSISFKSLESGGVLQPDELYNAVHILAYKYEFQLGLQLPKLNWKPHLYQLVRSLALPVELYDAVRRLVQLLDIDFTLRFLRKSPSAVLGDPETQLIALLVVAVRMLYPFDHAATKDVPAQSRTAFGAEIMDWAVWFRERDRHDQLLAEARSGGELSNEAAAEMTSRDAARASCEKLDRWMNWFEQTYVEDAVRQGESDKDFVQFMLEKFPMGATTTREDLAIAGTNAAEEAEKLQDKALKLESQRLETVMAAVRPRTMEQGSSPGLLGESYRPIRGVRDVKKGFELRFFEAVADFTGMSTERLRNAVTQVDLRIQYRWVGESHKS